jgi:DNA-directed RNA polymerase subunit RPC12/RpoP
MSQQTLKDLLKPPIGVTFGYHSMLFIRNGDNKNVLSLIGDMKDVGKHELADNLRKRLNEWIAEALNEKRERDFGERKRWKKAIDSDDYLCEACDTSFYFNGHSPDNLRYKFCPHCGQRLLPPC